MNPSGYGPDPASSNTTFVQADPATFRSVVQKLTGASQDPSAEKLPVSHPTRFAHPKPDVGPRRPAFKLHERRQAAKKLELNLAANPAFAPGAWLASPHAWLRCGDASPVSTLEFMAARGGGAMTPKTPRSEGEEEEKRAIAERGFYLHPSPVSTPRPGSDPPELLTLFPLQSPRESAMSN